MTDAEEMQFVEDALRCVESGNAGHWPTVAGYLADEVKSRRAELDRLTSEPYRKAVIDRMKEQKAEIESLRSAVERVREVCVEESYNDACDELIVRTSDVLQALDGS